MNRFIVGIKRIIRKYLKGVLLLFSFAVVSMVLALIAGKLYQGWDDDEDRGAIAINDGAFDESYSTPVYLDQGWDNSESLWFYNTTQGSILIPYDFFLVLEQADSEERFIADSNVDKYRYLPQKKTFFNPDALPLGFVKDTYQGPLQDKAMDYVGYTCAACHTGQINYQKQALRIDGAPAMANMVGFLTGLEQSMQATLTKDDKKSRFVEAVLALDNDFNNEAEVLASLAEWTNTIIRYNNINHTDTEYGYARLDAFGRIFNRVLEHVLNRPQLKSVLLAVSDKTGQRLMTPEQVELVIAGLDETIVGSAGIGKVVERLQRQDDGYPGLSGEEVLLVRNRLFNEPDAPVSYPFLWDIPYSDYLQWNGLANNADAGPLGRNAGQVVGVFGKLDWQAKEPGFTLEYFAEKASGQTKKKKIIDFTSSIDLVNLKRLESHLKKLTSPAWPETFFGEAGKLDQTLVDQGEQIYARYCLSCHEVVDPKNFDRLVIGKMIDVDIIGTDPAMAANSVDRTGQSGNFQYSVLGTGVGPVAMGETAPVAMILTAATRGVVATPDADKWIFRRWLDWLYIMAMSFFDNDIAYSVKNGNYKPDTTAAPFNSLLSYKARSLNGIWATAPYLHNGSVPTLYDLLLPATCAEGEPPSECRPKTFQVGSREFDPKRVGFISEGYEGFEFDTSQPGNSNGGHEYAAGKTPQLNGEILPKLSEADRWALVEYLKTL